MPEDFLNRWTLDDDEGNPYHNVPAIAGALLAARLGSTYPYNNYNYSSDRVVDGGFVRLKQVSLSYNLPSRFISVTGLSDLSISLLGSNLFLLYSDKRLNGQDPEFFSSGGVALPVPRQFTLSLKAVL